ncbi:MAG: pantetheine-phosphate adenylyltransferase [Treponema sp.]|nr:pantetheine-phosphate adenylyltransferase [Treponema sp.]
MTRAVFAGSFDPPTNGHLDIINRASSLFDAVDVVIAVNDSKKTLFSQQEREEMFNELIKPLKNVTVHSWNGLVVDYAKQTGAKVLIRGIRNTTDFAYEFDLSLMNYNLNPEVETLFLPTSQKYLLLKSSTIKELAHFGGDISGMVPKIVENAIKEKVKQNKL